MHRLWRQERLPTDDEPGADAGSTQRPPARPDRRLLLNAYGIGQRVLGIANCWRQHHRIRLVHRVLTWVTLRTRRLIQWHRKQIEKEAQRDKELNHTGQLDHGSIAESQ